MTFHDEVEHDMETETANIRFEDIAPQIIDIIGGMANVICEQGDELPSATKEEIVQIILDDFAWAHRLNVDIGKLVVERLKHEYTKSLSRNVIKETEGDQTSE